MILIALAMECIDIGMATQNANSLFLVFAGACLQMVGAKDKKAS
jgi:hypothetical protein